MSETLKQITVETFLIEKESSLLPTVLEYIESSPITHDEKIKELSKLVKIGVAFGLEKGENISRWVSDRVKRANADAETKWIRQFISDYNESGEKQVVKK